MKGYRSWMMRWKRKAGHFTWNLTIQIPPRDLGMTEYAGQPLECFRLEHNMMQFLKNPLARVVRVA